MACGILCLSGSQWVHTMIETSSVSRESNLRISCAQGTVGEINIVLNYTKYRMVQKRTVQDRYKTMI